MISSHLDIRLRVILGPDDDAHETTAALVGLLTDGGLLVESISIETVHTTERFAP